MVGAAWLGTVSELHAFTFHENDQHPCPAFKSHPSPSDTILRRHIMGGHPAATGHSMSVRWHEAGEHMSCPCPCTLHRRHREAQLVVKTTKLALPLRPAWISPSLLGVECVHRTLDPMGWGETRRRTSSASGLSTIQGT